MEKKTVLIVDDMPENLVILYRTLQDDYEIIGANSGQEALRLVPSINPDLILLDIMMPEMSGYEACRILKAQEATREIPVIFVTALTDETDETKGFELGAVDYITKPFKPAILKQRIATHLNLRQAEKDKRAFEQQFQQIQKLESLGVLAGGIAHDFNNILTIITGQCYLALLNPENACDHIPPIQNAAGRAAELCNQMLAYAGKALFIPSKIHLTELVDGVVKIMKTTIATHVTITSDLASDIPHFTGDVEHLKRIVINLIVNSVEAISEREGTVQVALANTLLTAKQPDKDHFGKVIPPGRYACLEVTDNGCGMDDETKNRIFEPFYTTKFTGRGLGMSATLGIVTAHKGSVQLSSHPCQGTTIKVYFPVQA